MDNNHTPLNPTWRLRAATRADAPAVADLMYAVCEADGDATVADTPEDLLHQWSEEGFDLGSNTLLVETAEGQVIGFESFFNEKEHAHLEIDGYVHPHYKNRGIGTALVKWGETRARKEMERAAPDLRVFLRGITDGRDADGKTLYTNMGYTPIRYHWRMEITLNEEPSAPQFPGGVELRPFEPEAHARLMWEADNEAFREHWGTHDSTFDEWKFRKFERPEYDPNLWLVAWDGTQIAGFAQNRYRSGMGWVGTLGVRKPWRKKGLGLALLQSSFRDFYQRGTHTIGLGVDAANTTGATRLYQRAGMQVASEFVNFEKELRPGRSLEE